MQNQNESEFIFIKQRLCILAKYLTSCMFFKYCRLLRASTCQTVIFLFVLRFSTKLRNMPRSQVLFITWKIQRIEQELFGIGVGRTLTTVFLPTYPFCFDLQHCSREDCIYMAGYVWQLPAWLWKAAISSVPSPGIQKKGALSSSLVGQLPLCPSLVFSLEQ